MENLKIGSKKLEKLKIAIITTARLYNLENKIRLKL